MDKDVTSKLKALSDISSIDITLEFDSILQDILKITCVEMEAHSGTIMLVDESSNELRMVASYGLPDNYIERVYEAARKEGVPISSSPSGIVLQTGKYYTVPDISKEPKDRPWLHLAKEIGFSSQIFTPMKRGLAVTGLLNVYMAEPHQFTEYEINFVTVAASQAASVVQNARICARLKNNVEELKGYKDHLEKLIRDTHKKLYDSERYLRSIIETSIDGIAVVDDKGRIEFGNDSFFTIIGWPREEIIGHSFIKMLTGDTKELYLRIWNNAQSMVPDTGNQAEAKIQTKNNEIRFLHVSRARTYFEGKKKFVFIAKDITENKKLELELKEADRLKTEFISNITHELLTPLASIRGFAELLDDGAMGRINKEQKRSMEIILRNSDRLIRLVRELLDAAHLEKNRLKLEFRLVSMNNIILKSIQDMHPHAKNKQIIINRKIQPLPRIWGDEERLSQVITNLLFNAIKFTPQKGTITVTAAEDENRIEISITDTGIGIPADKLSRVFDRFYQVDGSSSRKYGGVGLGLSVCKSIVEKHNGSIRAESNGTGSTFHIVLPKSTAKNQGGENVIT